MAQEGDGSKIKEDWADTLRGKKMFVGFCGPIGAGKTTAAKYLVEQHDFDRLPFAKVLKDMCRAFGLSEEQINGHLKEVPCEELGGRSPREFMQELGTDLGRKRFGENIWVKAWQRQARAFKRVVVDDVRFDNEVDAIHDLGGKVFLIDRGIQWSGDHASEQWHALKWDRGIVNGGSVDDLHRAIEAVLWPAWPLEATPA